MPRPKARQHEKRKSPPGRLRIVAGKWRSRLVPVADVSGLRPTSERVRETLFNWLAAGIDGARCLDLYAGSGALGFEALSRGAGYVQFVDNSRIAIDALKNAAGILGATSCDIVRADALEFLSAGCERRFDIVFLDPPFSTDNIEELCRLLKDRNWLVGDARIYIELPRDRAMPVLPDDWEILKDKTTGNVRYILLSAV